MSEEKNVQDFCSDDDVLPGMEETQPEAEQPAAQEEPQVPIPPRFEDSYPDGPRFHRPPLRRLFKDGAESSGSQLPPPPDPAVFDGMREENRTAFEEIKAQNEALREQNEALKAQLDAVGERLDRITAQMANTNRAVAMHETIEGNLNKELQSYKNDFYGKLATPFLMQLISLYAEMKKELDDLQAEIDASEEPTGHEDVVSSLAYYLDKIQGSLVNSGVEMETPAAGEKIDPLKQSIVRTVQSDDPEMNGVIESVRSDTYLYNNKVLLRAKVAVYKSKINGGK